MIVLSRLPRDLASAFRMISSFEKLFNDLIILKILVMSKIPEN